MKFTPTQFETNVNTPWKNKTWYRIYRLDCDGETGEVFAEYMKMARPYPGHMSATSTGLGRVKTIDEASKLCEKHAKRRFRKTVRLIFIPTRLETNVGQPWKGKRWYSIRRRDDLLETYTATSWTVTDPIKENFSAGGSFLGEVSLFDDAVNLCMRHARREKVK